MSAGSPISWDGLRSLHKLGHRRADQGAECGHGQCDRAAHRGELSPYLSAVGVSPPEITSPIQVQHGP